VAQHAQLVVPIVVGREMVAGGEGQEMSPLELLPIPPTLASPVVARWASRRHWVGISGASVAMITMIELEFSCASQPDGTLLSEISRPTA
jgi:hypothetical protein